MNARVKPAFVDSQSGRHGFIRAHWMVLLTVIGVMVFKATPMMSGAVGVVQDAKIQANLEAIRMAKSLWAANPTNLMVRSTDEPTWDDLAPYITVGGEVLTPPAWTNLLVGTGCRSISIHDLATPPTMSPEAMEPAGSRVDWFARLRAVLRGD